MIGVASSLALMALLQVQLPPVAGRAAVLTVVSGTVTPADAAAPMVSATVTLRPLDDLISTSTPVRSRLQSRSDQLGRVSFLVPPGRYAISTEREGYIREERFQLGTNQPPQTILTVTASQNIENLLVVMKPAFSISGVVSGPDGQPVAAATVQAFRVKYNPLGPQLVASSKVLSHEGGEYRLFNLDPGFYYLSASISSRTVQSWTSVVTFTPNLPDPGEGFTTTFFPDETSVSRARLIYLNSQSAFKVDLIFRNVPNFRVSARLTLPPNGQPFLNPNVALVPAGVDLAAASNYRMGRSGSNFTMNRVADGIYTIVATAEYPNSGGGTTTVIVSSPRTVQISDNTELSLEAVGAIEIPGRFVLEGNAPAAFRRSSEMKVQMIRTDRYSSEINAADFKPDGSFTFSNVGPGIYDVFLQGFPTNLFISDASVGLGFQRLDRIQINTIQPPRAFNSETQLWQSTVPLTITVSASGGIAEGTVIDGARLSAGAEVILVPALETARLRKDRYFMARSDESGRFRVDGIPPGPYAAFAFQKLEPDINFDSTFIGQVLFRGSNVEIKSGSTETLRLNIITAEELSRMVR